ncbi:MAG: hypothetical protein KJ646_02340 [Nanoarchaeota archaeon]|nr:hypothetical protein [Nanoarchaeota archaeon]MBU4116405.1 hypothetical protein [Nanoarchaeota archaeon]
MKKNLVEMLGTFDLTFIPTSYIRRAIKDDKEFKENETLIERCNQYLFHFTLEVCRLGIYAGMYAIIKDFN